MFARNLALSALAFLGSACLALASDQSVQPVSEPNPSSACALEGDRLYVEAGNGHDIYVCENGSYRFLWHRDLTEQND